MKKSVLSLFVFLFLSFLSFAQGKILLHQRSGENIKMRIKTTDSLSFRVMDPLSSSEQKLCVYDKNGTIQTFDVNVIDSITYEKNTISEKNGFVLFRVDDSHISNELLPMASVFEKYGFKMINCFNPSIINDDIRKGILEFQKRGHEITDHTPNHTTGFADMSTEIEAKSFIGMPGVKEVNGLRVIFDWKGPDLSNCIVKDEFIEINSGSNLIKGSISKIAFPDELIYTVEYGWVMLKQVSNTQAIALDPKTRQVITFMNNSTEQLYKAYTYAFFPTVEAMSALMKASQILFKDIGLRSPTIWCMCGGPWAMGRGDIIRDAGRSLGYLGGSEQSYPNGNIPLTFNQSNPLSRWSMQPQSINMDSYGPTEIIKRISNDVAKHKGVSILGHMSYKDTTLSVVYRGIKTEIQSKFLNNLDVILKFCFDNDIPVVTYHDIISNLFDKDSDSLINVMPSLYNDLTSQGYPDGYSLDAGTSTIKDDGVLEDKGYSLKRKGTGSIFKITGLGGLERGSNKFTFYAKGPENTNLIFDVRSLNEEKTYSSILKTITGASSSFVKFETNIDIPNNVDSFTLEVRISNVGGKDFSISGMYLGK